MEDKDELLGDATFHVTLTTLMIRTIPHPNQLYGIKPLFDTGGHSSFLYQPRWLAETNLLDIVSSRISAILM